MTPTGKPGGRTFRLLPYFSVASAVTIAAATLILALTYGEIARRNFLQTATDESVAMSRAVANNLWRHQRSTIALLSTLEAEALRRHPELPVLRQAVNDATRNLPIRKVKLYDVDGDVLFSTESAEIGDSQAKNPGVVAALAGKVASKLIEHDEKEERSHDYVTDAHDIVESYIPIRPAGEGGPVEGVFELYYEVTAVLEGLQRAQIFAAVAVATTLLTLYGILYLVVMRADGILRRQHESNLRLSEAIEYADSGVMITGAGSVATAPLLYKNRALDDMHGGAVESAMDLLGEKGEQAYQSLVDELRTGRAVQFEFSHVGDDEAHRWLQVRGNPVLDDTGDVVRLVWVVADVTERKTAEEWLFRVDQDLRTISACNQALVRATGESELLEEICRILVDVGKQSYAGVSYVDAAAPERVRLVASYSDGSKLPEVLVGPWRALELRLIREAIATGRPAVAHDVAADPEFPACEEELCCRSIVVLPLLPAEGPAFGVLAVHAVPAKLYENEGLNLVNELANDLAYGVVARRAAEERAQAEESLRKLSRAVEQSGSLVVITDTKGRIEYVNPKFTEVTGYTPDEVIGRNPNLLKSGETADEAYADLWNDIQAGKDWRGTFHNRRKDGSMFWVVASISPIRAADGTVTHFVGIEEDITERVEQEMRLRQTEKMEALGNLAGGIAHDLNNMLLPILALSEMTADELPAGGDQEQRIRRVVQAAERSRSLVQRILAFSHQNEPTRETLAIHTVVEDYLGLLKTTLPSSIRIVADIDPDAGHIIGDATQLGNVLLNLGSNASDAMGDQPGQLTVSLHRTELVRQDATAAGAAPGAYARLTVTDTGHGMPAAVMERIFDPFFTTKPVGKGTGLGLSVAYGVITSHGGTIDVHSEPGKGTTFEILIPLVAEGETAATDRSDGDDSHSEPALA